MVHNMKNLLLLHFGVSYSRGRQPRRTWTGPWPVRNQATQQEVTGGQAPHFRLSFASCPPSFTNLDLLELSYLTSFSCYYQKLGHWYNYNDFRWNRKTQLSMNGFLHRHPPSLGICFRELNYLTLINDSL